MSVFYRVKGILCTYYLGMISQRSVVIFLLTLLYVSKKGRWISHVVGEIYICQVLA